MIRMLRAAVALVLAIPCAGAARAATPRAADLAFSTFLGTLGNEYATGVAVGPSGDVYLVGQTTSASFPVVGAVQPASAGGLDVFVAKLAADGSGIVWATYLGGSGDDTGTGIAVDAAGCAYVTGQTTSKNFPTTLGAFDGTNGRFPTCSGADCLDSFVAKFSADGHALVYSTYLGGEHDDYAYGIAVDASGHAFVTGSTNSFGFPRVNAFDPEKRLGAEAFITKMSADGTAVEYSSYIGGNRGDAAFAVAVDAEGNAVIAGDTLSTDFLTKSPLQPQNASAADTSGALDAFVAKVDPSGALVFSTYLGGRGRDFARGVAVDGSGAIYVAGETSSPDFPLVSPIRASLAGGSDAFVAKLRADGSALVYATYLGGTGDDAAAAIAVDDAGRAAVVGSTRSADFPTADPVQAACGGCAAPGFFADVFVTVLDPGGARLDVSTYLGGSAEDEGLAVASAPGGAFVLAGRTFSTNFPTTPDAYQASCVCGAGNTQSAFVARLDGPSAPVEPPTISGIAALKRPFRLVISGTGFAAGAMVFVGDDATPWPTAQVSSASAITLGGGKTLKARFPKGASVAVRVVNPDGGEAVAQFAR